MCLQDSAFVFYLSVPSKAQSPVPGTRQGQLDVRVEGEPGFPLGNVCTSKMSRPSGHTMLLTFYQFGEFRKEASMGVRGGKKPPIQSRPRGPLSGTASGTWLRSGSRRKKSGCCLGRVGGACWPGVAPGLSGCGICSLPSPSGLVFCEPLPSSRCDFPPTPLVFSDSIFGRGLVLHSPQPSPSPPCLPSPKASGIRNSI